jgi:effector-binding domain-containing protein
MGRRIAIAAAGVAVIAVTLAILLWPRGHVLAPAGVASGAAPTGGSASGSAVTMNLIPPGLIPGQDPSVASALGTFTGDILTLKARPMLYIAGKVSVVAASPNKVVRAAYAKIRAYIADHDLAADGAPFAITTGFDQKSQVWSYEAGIALAAPPPTPPAPSDGIALGKTYAGTVARFVHIGDPDKAQPTYAKISDWMRANGLNGGQPTWEEYVSDPSTPVGQWHTNIYVPIE